MFTGYDRSDPRRRFGRRLAQIRRSLPLTQAELAERSGIHRTYISGLENGERNIGLLNLVRLADALGVEPVELLRWDDATGSGPARDVGAQSRPCSSSPTSTSAVSAARS